MEKIPCYIESENGHDIKEVPTDEIEKEVENLLQQDKWVTIEKKNGETEILTKDDLPKAENTTDLPKSEEEENTEWKEIFGKKENSKEVVKEEIQSVTATSKAKGG